MPATLPHPATIATRNPLILWHLLSLDAPTVALAWLLLVVHPIPRALPAAMFLALWIIYAADRLLDATLATTPAARTLEPRHLFHLYHRRAFLITIAAAALVLAALLPHLPTALLYRYALLAAALTLWLALIHFLPRLRLPKELAVGLFFATAIFLPLFPAPPAIDLPALASPDLTIPALAFALLCTVNCLYIRAWEHPRHRPPTFLLALLLLAPILIPSRITFATALAAALLFALHHFRARLAPTTLRAAADLTLLTPLLFLWPRSL